MTILTRPAARSSHKPRVHWFKRIDAAYTAWRHRRHLDELDAFMRRDIGLSDSEIHHETQRKFWDVPQNWRL